MYEQSEQQEENVLMMNDEDSDTDGRPLESDELSFSWFLIRVRQEIQKLCGPNHALFKRKNISYHVQLLLMFIIFIFATIIGAHYLNDCYNERMICIFLIVQGVCGLIVVLVHISAAIVR
jgi:hypothetical protein